MKLYFLLSFSLVCFGLHASKNKFANISKSHRFEQAMKNKAWALEQQIKQEKDPEKIKKLELELIVIKGMRYMA